MNLVGRVEGEEDEEGAEESDGGQADDEINKNNL
jgi:hypothetical protein